MAVEPRRGCGYRKIGGLYLVSDHRGGVVCDRLSIALDICPTCSHGIKQTRGWTWVDAATLIGGLHPQCEDNFPCQLCMTPGDLGRCGLLWITPAFVPDEDPDHRGTVYEEDNGEASEATGTVSGPPAE